MRLRYLGDIFSKKNSEQKLEFWKIYIHHYEHITKFSNEICVDNNVNFL